MLQLNIQPPLGYFIAILCDFLRRKWISAGESFTSETVMSGPDKLELFRAARVVGFRNYLYFISTDSPAVNRERVASRVANGGHDVPAEKILTRYERSVRQVRAAISLSDRAFIFDNSGKSHRLIAEFENDQLVQISKDLPTWFATHVLPFFQRDRE